MEGEIRAEVASEMQEQLDSLHATYQACMAESNHTTSTRYGMLDHTSIPLNAAVSLNKKIDILTASVSRSARKRTKHTVW